VAAQLQHPTVKLNGAGVISHARAAQDNWRSISIRERLSYLRRIRNSIAHNPRPLVEAVRLTRNRCPDSEILVSEVLPFLDAIKFLEREAQVLLRRSHPAEAGRPFWLSGIELEIDREPVGVALIIAASNYPLFLPGVQLVQALAAGNAVLIKPGSGASPAMLSLRAYFISAGLPPELVTVVDESAETAKDLIVAGADKIWLTGSAGTGRAVAQIAAATLTPLVCELSGCGTGVVLPEADAALAARAVAFGLELNQSQTCMRPHRLLVHHSLEADFTRELLSRLSSVRISLKVELADELQMLVNNARCHGALQLLGNVKDDAATPFVLTNVAPDSELWSADIFAPVIALNTFGSIEKAVQLHNDCAYGLVTSVFGPETNARAIASRLKAGTVVVNDVIVPTADPRLPFSGRGNSGYGTTRGAEGLLEFTRPKAVTTRRWGYRHLDRSHRSDAAIFSGAIAVAHDRDVINRFRAALNALKAGLRRGSNSQRSSPHESN
jgi:acyl-CoA reductase-like NAD-dependent aldehyde dehydrogenase